MHALHSPKTPTTTKMLDRVLSSRRANSHTGDDPDPNSSADDSKTRKQNVYLLAFNYVSRLSHFCICPTPCLLLFLLLAVVLIGSVAFHSRSFVCVSDPGVSRVGFFGLDGLDGLDSDFGLLGVPWCKSLSNPPSLSICVFGLGLDLY